MAGMEGRANLLLRLSEALDEKREFFGENGRPGNMLGEEQPPPPPRLPGSLD